MQGGSHEGAILPTLDLKKILRQKDPDLPTAKSTSEPEIPSPSKRNRYGAWYVAPEEWNAIYTARYSGGG